MKLVVILLVVSVIVCVYAILTQYNKEKISYNDGKCCCGENLILFNKYSHGEREYKCKKCKRCVLITFPVDMICTKDKNKNVRC